MQGRTYVYARFSYYNPIPTVSIQTGNGFYFAFSARLFFAIEQYFKQKNPPRLRRIFLLYAEII